MAGFAKVATIEEVLGKDANLSIPRYVRPFNADVRTNGEGQLKADWTPFDAGGREFWQQMDALLEALDSAVSEEVDDV